MAIPRPKSLGQAQVAEGAMQQQVYQRNRGRGYRQRYLDYKRQDWMFRVQLAQTQVTEEYRQSVGYNKQLQDAIGSYQDLGQSLRTSIRQTEEAIASTTLQIFNVESKAYDQRHQMLEYRIQGERKLVKDLNVKQGSEAALETMQVALTDIIDGNATWSTAEADIKAALISSGTTDGLQGAISTIGNAEVRGSISHRQAARLVANYILTSTEFASTQTGRSGFRGATKTSVDAMVEKAFGLDAGSLTGLDTDYDDAYTDGVAAVELASPLDLTRTTVDSEGKRVNAYSQAQEGLALRKNQLASQQVGLDALLTEVQQEQLNLQAELEQRGQPEPADYDAVLQAAMEGYQEPVSRNRQFQLNRERKRLRTQNRLLDEAPPEMRAIVLAGAEAARRKRLGLAVSDDEETIARATELMAGYGESFDPNELQTLAEDWARGRYQTEWETANPDATEIYWDSDQIASYQNDLISAVLGQYDNQYGGVQESAGTPGPTVTEEPEPAPEEEIRIEPLPELEE